jgi:hypothetical protein
MDVREEIAKEVRAYRRHDAAKERSRLRLAELFRIARAEDIGPAEIARVADRLYTPDHISRITQAEPEKADPPKK